MKHINVEFKCLGCNRCTMIIRVNKTSDRDITSEINNIVNHGNIIDKAILFTKKIFSGKGIFEYIANEECTGVGKTVYTSVVGTRLEYIPRLSEHVTNHSSKNDVLTCISFAIIEFKHKLDPENNPSILEVIEL